MTRLLAAPLILTALAAPVLAEDIEVKRVLRLDAKGGAFSTRVRGVLGNAKVRSFTVLVDWWTGPGDERVGDPEKAETGGFVFEVRHGQRWRALPEAKRDLRLTARVEAQEGLLGEASFGGEWHVRQTKGEEKVRAVRIEAVLLVPWGKSLILPDLVIRGVRFTDVEADPPAPGRFPLRRDFPEIAAGGTYPARVHLENRGYGDAREPAVGMFLTRLDGKGRKGIPGLQIGITVREGEDLEKKWEMKVPAKLGPGLYLLHAVADPRNKTKELSEENNEFVRVVRVVAP